MSRFVILPTVFKILFFFPYPLRGASLVFAYNNLSIPQWEGSLVALMCFCHFKELNKNLVSVFTQCNFRIEVLCCKPDFSFHLVTPGEIVYLKFKQYLGKENFSLYVVGKANERQALRNDWVTFLFASLTFPPVAPVLWGCQRTSASWCGLEMPDPWNKSSGGEKCEWGRNRFEESMWPQTDIIGSNGCKIGKELCVLHKFSLGRRLFNL